MITKIGGEGNVLAYEATGKVTEEEYQRVVGELRQAIAEHGKIRLLGRLPDSALPGTELATIDDRLRFAKDHLGDIEKAAMVGDSTAAEWITKVSDKVTGAKMRHFGAGEEAQAWAWLREDR